MTDTAQPSRISGVPMMCRPQGMPGNGGSSCAMASPPTISASDVRLHARNVRSLAKVKRASGSAPSPLSPVTGEPSPAGWSVTRSPPSFAHSGRRMLLAEYGGDLLVHHHPPGHPPRHLPAGTVTRPRYPLNQMRHLDVSTASAR